LALSGGYLASRQLKIWDLRRKGLREASIARDLNISRQAVHKAVDSANSKVSQALLETAQLNKMRVEAVDPATGVLKGYSSEFRTSVVITFSAKNGVQIWYKHEGNCTNCDRHEQCKQTLLEEMKERNITSLFRVNSTSPSEMAAYLIQKLTGG
jgi:transcriptional regulator